MKAYDELRNRRKLAARKSKALQLKLEENWELIENNYGQMIFDEVEKKLLPVGSVSNRLLRFLLGKNQAKKQELNALQRQNVGYEAKASNLPLINQALNFAKPLLLTLALGLVKRKIRRKVRGAR